MRRYLSEFLSDKRVIDYPRWKWQPILQLIVLSKRPFSSGSAYRSIWNVKSNESPLITITKEQTDQLRKVLLLRFGESVVVDFSMRYGNPSTESQIERMVEAGCTKILFFPLYPQYSSASTASSNDALFKTLLKLKWQPSVRTVAPYFDNQFYIDALAASVQTALTKLDFVPDPLVVSFHGLPSRYLTEGDPYHCHCQKTSRLLKEKLGWTQEQIVTTFQSRFGSEEWLQPYTVDEVARLAREGRKEIAVIAPGFSADCIETLEEIEEEIQTAFKEAGGERFAYISCLNADEMHIRMMAEIIEANLAGWIEPKVI